MHYIFINSKKKEKKLSKERNKIVCYLVYYLILLYVYFGHIVVGINHFLSVLINYIEFKKYGVEITNK